MNLAVLYERLKARLEIKQDQSPFYSLFISIGELLKQQQKQQQQQRTMARWKA